jgi:hypothetical protein
LNPPGRSVRRFRSGSRVLFRSWFMEKPSSRSDEENVTRIDCWAGIHQRGISR